ncbi:GNAT family N-acetyltransferase [Aeromicrobium sp.]|uniref:GNAT family N-acetyltransferase n=1 Tax=Aeromicrobium sp. TaxID=1871063 RepID=UPI0025C718C7|nr:GNAT family N-acetyltransferase [Aeromicrobium sp.]
MPNVHTGAVSVVEATPDDWAQWRLLRQRSLTEDPEAFASSVTMWTGDHDVEARWRQRLADGPCFLARAGATPVGMAGGRRDGADAELISMWVAPEARGRGVGRLLIEAVVGWSDASVLSLRVIDGNSAAIGLYTSLGFALDEGCADAEGCRRMRLRR